MLPLPVSGVRFVRRLFAIAAEEPDFPILRAGLHHGEALERDGSFLGSTINVAARVAAQARGGQILATTAVADAARAEGIAVTSIGLVSLRHVRDSVELFELHPTVATGETDAIDPVCRMRVERKQAAGRLRFADVEYWFCSLPCVAAFAANPHAYLRD